MRLRLSGEPTFGEGAIDAEPVYSISEIIGTSPESIEAAIETAFAPARKTLRNLDWFVVTETRGLLSEVSSPNSR
jgi:dodecin